MKESYFNVGILGYMGYPILGVIICVFIFGVGTPWAVCMMQKSLRLMNFLRGRL